MGRELTRRHSGLFEKRIPNPFQFVYDVYAYGKLSELFSFMVWEVQHKLGLFPKAQYMRFTTHAVLSLAGDRVNRVEFNARLARHFAKHGLHLARSPHNWKLMLIYRCPLDDSSSIYGCLLPHDRNLYVSDDRGKSIRLIHTFPQPIKSIFVSSKETIFVCVKGSVYTSWDGGTAFQKTLNLGSPESFFRHNNAMTEMPDGTLIIAEYGNVWEQTRWKKLPYLYFSRDNGRTWQRTDFLIGEGINKHLHLVKYSTSLDRVFIADGDNKKKVWISDSNNPADLMKVSGWTPINKYHIQMGGYTSVVEHDGTIYFGTDYQGGTNFLVSTRDGKRYEKQIVPDPYRRSPIDNMVLRKSKHGTEIWANLPYSTSQSKCLLMYSVDGGKEWRRVLEYDRAAYKVWIVSSSNEATDDLYVSIEDLKHAERAVYRLSDSPFDQG
jgi:hypothetical protein